MPVSRLPNRKLLYFAHVPKCAGTAVEHYLQARFGPLGLLDSGFGRRSRIEAWSLSPPQHMPEAVRRDLLPDVLFDALFATVRHPALRLRSVYLFQREVEKALPPTLKFERWLETLPRTLALDPYALHGHLRPMAETVPEHARVFRVEEGFGPLVDWLDMTAGDESGPRQIAPVNRLTDRLGQNAPQLPVLGPALCSRIAALYAVDYERFGYDVLPPLAEVAES
jgi:hypothetical protein